MSTLRASTTVGTIEASEALPDDHVHEGSLAHWDGPDESPSPPLPHRDAGAGSGAGSRTNRGRSKSLHDYLCAQTDVDEEVLQVYKLVCRS
jgi:hypothetical protein